VLLGHAEYADIWNKKLHPAAPRWYSEDTLKRRGDENMLLKLVISYFLIMNIAGYMSMMVDKRRAIAGRRRIPEKTLLTYAVLGGSIGSILGMLAFRHKTRHRKFTLGLPAILIMQVLIAAAAAV
jgi:uncharacterized membrane protein YsdA (DUF1294 family)